MSYTVYDFSESLDRLNAVDHGFAREDVRGCLAAWGETGDMAEWEGGFLLLLRDGRAAYLTGWCDTTGWGCQDGIQAAVVPAIDDAAGFVWPDGVPHALDTLPVDLNRFLRGEIDKLFEDERV